MMMAYGLQKPAKKKAKKAAPVQVKKEMDDFKPAKSKSKAAVKQESKSPQKGKKGEKKEEPVVWKWWEEEKKEGDNSKWRFLEHRGPLFAPDYEKLPKSVR